MKRLTLVLAFLLTALCARANTVYIHAGQLIDGKSAKPLAAQTVVVTGNTITQVAAGYVEAPAEATLIDLKSHTLMPGLMDMHTHLSNRYDQHDYLKRFTLNEADYALQAVGFAEKTLLAGFTTVRDLGDRYNVTVALRKAVDAGLVDGPRIYTAAKSIATTGGHADPTNGYRKDLMRSPRPAHGVVNGVAAAREAVRQRYKDGADLIKITATGGVLSVAKSGHNPQFMADELAAIVATAKDYGLTVAVHAHGAEGMKRAIVAGVDSIEHGTFMDDEAIKLMKKYGTYYVPTIMAGDWVAEKSKIDGFFPELVRAKAAEIGPLMQRTFAKAYRAGVKIAFGTDSGVSAHGDNAREFALMVEAGMTPMEAIKAATREAAGLLKIDTMLGSIERGKLADLVAVEGNPLADISRLQTMAFVMKDGRVYKADLR